MSRVRPPTGAPLYRATGVYVLRAAVLPADTFPNLAADTGEDVGPDLGKAVTAVPPDDPTGDLTTDLAAARAEGRERLRALAARPRVQQALHAASPSLATALRSFAQVAEPSRLRDLGRADAGLLRYLTRMSTRPTPLGLFAGVTIGAFGARTTAVLDDDPVRATVTRADRGWLAELTERLGEDRDLRERLPVRVDALAYRAGPSMILFRSDRPGAPSGERAEIAATAAVRAAFELADDHPTFTELLSRMVARFPAVPRERVLALLHQLWDAGFLRSDLLSPLTEPFPEQRLLKRLAGLGLPGHVTEGLDRMRRLADDIDRAGGHAGLAAVERLDRHQRALTPGFDGPTYRVDTVLAANPAELHAGVAEAAAEAAEVLLRLGCLDPRLPHLVGYHREFLERYGADSELPLLEVLNPETGLGPPNTYQLPPRFLPWPETPPARHEHRERALADLVARALRHDMSEVELDDALMEALSTWRPDDSRCRPDPSLDLLFQIAAESAQAIDEGRWRLVLSTIGAYGGCQSLGRFADLLGEPALRRVREHQRTEEALRPGTVFAELAYLPTRARGLNLAVHPPSRGYEICVNVPPTLPPDRQIPLDDILLGATGERFRLRSRRLGRELVVGRTYALSDSFAPNVCRALLEFSADGFTPRAEFDWGVLRDLPRLPRLRRGRVIVQPAQWTVTAATFTERDLDGDAFFHACRGWRREWGVPRHVYLTVLDNRLLLDLEHPLWVDELRREIVRARREPAGEPVRLQEVLPDFPELWLRDRGGRRYHAELAVPLVLRDSARLPEPGEARQPEPAEGRQPEPAETRTGSSATVRRRWLPGERWVYLKLYAAAEQHDAIISGPLRSLLAGHADSGAVDRWFYLRYIDPHPHLRLRFHCSDTGDPDEVLAGCARWGRLVVADGLAADLAFGSYDREVERYGGPLAMDALEHVFWRNSEVCADLVRLVHDGKGRYDADVVAVAALDALHRSWGAPPATAARPADVVRRRFRALRPLLCQILSPDGHHPDSRAARYLEALPPILARQDGALRAAGDLVRRLARENRLAGSERNVQGSLAHLQSIRLLGIDAGREEECAALWSLAVRAVRGRALATHREGARA
ncbi:MAG TPA: lantibiotic dehydratase [Nonomuraea sp.]|nr:lantibiotic dehydratase [Nonomuraea sp.]